MRKGKIRRKIEKDISKCPSIDVKIYIYVCIFELFFYFFGAASERIEATESFAPGLALRQNGANSSLGTFDNDSISSRKLSKPRVDSKNMTEWL